MLNLAASYSAVLPIDTIPNSDGSTIDRTRTAGELSVDVKYSLAVYATLEEEDNYTCEKLHVDYSLGVRTSFPSVSSLYVYILFITINNDHNEDCKDIYNIVKLLFILHNQLFGWSIKKHAHSHLHIWRELQCDTYNSTNSFKKKQKTIMFYFETSHPNANTARQQQCWDARCEWWFCSTQFCKKLLYTVAPVPQDLLVNYTWALLLNMGWKHAWVASIKHFLCCTFFLWYTVMRGAEGAHVYDWHSGTKKRREELFISSLFRSFSLPPDPRVQQLQGKCRIANEVPEKLN